MIVQQSFEQQENRELIGWLTGAMGSMGIQIPDNLFSLKGIFSLVTQILGLSWNYIRTKAVKLLTEPVVAAMEKGSDIFKILQKDGLEGVWEYIQEQFTDLKESVIGEIKNMVITQVITAGIKWVIGLLNPASAFVKAAMTIYDIAMFFVNRGSQIIELVKAVTESIKAIASGSVGAVAKAIEGALAKSVPVLIGFLASLLGIGGLVGKVQNIIKKIRKRIDKAIDRLLLKAKKSFKNLTQKGKVFIKKTSNKIKEKFVSIKDIKEKFKTKEGESHTLFLKGKASFVKIQIASKPEHISLFLNKKQSEVNSSFSIDPQEKNKLTNHIITARNLVSQIEGLTYPSDPNAPIPEALERKVNTLMKQLTREVKQINTTNEKPVPPVSIVPGFSSNKATGLKVRNLLKGHHQAGTPAASYKGTLHGAIPILISLNVRHKWVAFHLLNENTGGLAVDSNLIPAPQSVNKDYLQKFERQWKDLHKNNEVLWMDISLSYRDEFFVNNINVKGGKMSFNKKNNSWDIDKKHKIPDWISTIPLPKSPTISINKLPSDKTQIRYIADLTPMEKGLLIELADRLAPSINNKEMLIDYVQNQYANKKNTRKKYIKQIKATNIDFSR